MRVKGIGHKRKASYMEKKEMIVDDNKKGESRPYNKDLQPQCRMRGSGDTLPAGLVVDGKSARINPVCSPTQGFSSHPEVCTHPCLITFLTLTSKVAKLLAGVGCNNLSTEYGIRRSEQQEDADSPAILSLPYCQLLFRRST